MKNVMKKLAAAALIAGVALCGPVTMNRAEAEEINKAAVAAEAAWITGDTTGVMVAGSAAKTMAYLKGAALLGGGVAAGAAAIAGSNALAGASIVNNTVFRDDEALDSEERSARQAGRVGSYTGAAVGTAAVYGVVATADSAAGITSTLAAIGATVGGGMITGTAIVVAAPAAIAAGVDGACYGCYKLVTWFWD